MNYLCAEQIGTRVISMIFGPKYMYFLRGVLLVTVFSFLLQLGMPHVSLAAEENFQALGAGEKPVFENNLLVPELRVDSEAGIFEREEKLFAPFSQKADLSLLAEAEEPRVVAERWLTVTAYSSTPDQTDGTPYTTGWLTPVRDGAVAANFLPLGTRVRFPDYFGDKIFVVEDRMNVRYRYRADVWMRTRAEAKQFGLKYLRLEILAGRLPRHYVLARYEPAFPGRK